MKNHKRPIQVMIFALLLVNFDWIVTEANAQISIIDQSNTVGGSITFGTLTPGQSLGQSFTPTLTGIDLFDIRASSRGVSTTQIELFSGQTTMGTPIATSGTVIIGNTTSQVTEFPFPETVLLVPGSIYTARLNHISGDSYLLAFSSADPYPRGLAFNEFGNAVPSVVWVFSEGLTLGGLSLRRIIFRRRSRSNEREPAVQIRRQIQRHLRLAYS